MKKKIIVLIMLLCIVCAAFTLAACQGGDGVTPNTPSGEPDEGGQTQTHTHT